MKNLGKINNITLLTFFKIFQNPLFWGPVIISYIINTGKMTLSEMYFMESVVLIIMLFTEIYSSAWADLLGRKKVLVIASLINLLAIIILAGASSPLGIWISNILIMVGFSLTSGTDKALIADYLNDEGRGDEYLEVVSKIESKVYFVAIFTTIISGYLYALNARLPFLLSIPGVALSFIVILFVKEKKRRDKATTREHFNLIKLSFVFVANNKKLKWIILFFTFLGFISKIWFFTFNPYFELVKLSPVYYGWIFSVLNFCAWIITKNSNKIYLKLGEFSTLLTSILTMGVPLLLLAIFPSKIILLVLIFSSFTRSILKTVSSSMKNHYLSPENRATVLSIGSSLNSISSAIALFLFGLLLKETSLENGILILGALVLIFGFLFLEKYRKVFK